jgi:hypothetical protein
MIGIFRVSGITIDVVVAAIGVIGCLAVTYATKSEMALDDRRYLAQYFGAQLESGTFRGDFSTPEWELDQVRRNASGGTGWRNYSIHVQFKHVFTAPPQMLANISLIDASSQANVRFLVGIDHIEKEGCDLVLRSWGDSKINWVEGTWLATQSAPRSAANSLHSP